MWKLTVVIKCKWRPSLWDSGSSSVWLRLKVRLWGWCPLERFSVAVPSWTGPVILIRLYDGLRNTPLAEKMIWWRWDYCGYNERWWAAIFKGIAAVILRSFWESKIYVLLAEIICHQFSKVVTQLWNMHIIVTFGGSNQCEDEENNAQQVMSTTRSTTPTLGPEHVVGHQQAPNLQQSSRLVEIQL